MGTQRLAKFIIFEDKGGEFRWRLVATNGKTIADSGEGYSDVSGARRAVTMVRETFKNGTRVVSELE